MREPPYLYPTPGSKEMLNRLLRLPATGDEQDWEVELADPARIAEWLALFEAAELDLEARSALALLLLCSILHAEPAAIPADAIPRLNAALRRDAPVGKRMRSYWRGWGFFAKTGDADLDAENAEYMASVCAALA
jgi:hypothetical protein